jgi:putative transposase
MATQHDYHSLKGQPQGIAPTNNGKNKSIGNIIDAYKSITTVEYIRGVKTMGWESFNGKLWQRNYYEHIIRNESSYQRISEYITNNPINWKNDEMYHP